MAHLLKAVLIVIAYLIYIVVVAILINLLCNYLIKKLGGDGVHFNRPFDKEYMRDSQRAREEYTHAQEPDKRGAALTILGLGVDASDDDIQKVYRKLAVQNHPDLFPGNKEKEAAMKKINAAYTYLTRKSAYV